MIKPTVIYEDKNFLVLSKPAGVIVNNADTTKDEFTLQNFVESEYSLIGERDSEFIRRGGIVHRLDKDTSGVMIVALNEKSFVFLQDQFKKREVRKKYLALCHGSMPHEGQVNVPIGRLPWNRKRFGVIPKGRESFTSFSLVRKYKLSQNNEILSLIEVFPKTGRTHQIRVHMQYAKHPIFADALYAGRKTFQNDKKNLSRQFLHASSISFNSPTTSKSVSFEAPLSFELEDFLKKLEEVYE